MALTVPIHCPFPGTTVMADVTSAIAMKRQAAIQIVVMIFILSF